MFAKSIELFLKDQMVVQNVRIKNLTTNRDEAKDEQSTERPQRTPY